MSRNKHIGSSFESFLKDESLHSEVTSHATRRVLAWQIETEMKRQGLTKVAMVKRMKTDRTQLYRLLDPSNDKVRFDTVQRVADAIGRRLHIALA
jgi:DNA-binding phage protein